MRLLEAAAKGFALVDVLAGEGDGDATYVTLEVVD